MFFIEKMTQLKSIIIEFTNIEYSTSIFYIFVLSHYNIFTCYTYCFRGYEPRPDYPDDDYKSAPAGVMSPFASTFNASA